VVKKKDAELGGIDLYDHYQAWCRENNVENPCISALIRGDMDGIQIELNPKYRHDLP